VTPLPFPRAPGSAARQLPSILRYAGALCLLALGAGHLQQDLGASYSMVPTIGTLFVLNFVSATVVGLALLAPAERLAGRHARLVLGLLAASGMAIGAGSLAALFVSETWGLFGFREFGYRGVIVLLIALEAGAVFLLAGFLATVLRSRA
jgi:hypothetical protein